MKKLSTLFFAAFLTLATGGAAFGHCGGCGVGGDDEHPADCAADCSEGKKADGDCDCKADCKADCAADCAADCSKGKKADGDCDCKADCADGEKACAHGSEKQAPAE